ncbi:hypothetical protein ES708_16343 [subsurface metagenome]
MNPDGAEEMPLHLRWFGWKAVIFKQKILLVLIWACCAICPARPAEQQETLGNFKNPVAVNEVLAGKHTGILTQFQTKVKKKGRGTNKRVFMYIFSKTASEKRFLASSR